LWLVFTPILCFVCWQTGGAHGPLFLSRSSKDVRATLTSVSLSDDLTNTPLGAYSFNLTTVPKADGVPASGYLLLVAVPRGDVLPLGALADGMLKLSGLFESEQEFLKPVAISSQMLAAQGPFMVFLDCQTRRPDLVEFRMPRLCRGK
jgi:hypothetical protein